MARNHRSKVPSLSLIHICVTVWICASMQINPQTLSFIYCIQIIAYSYCYYDDISISVQSYIESIIVIFLATNVNITLVVLYTFIVTSMLCALIRTQQRLSFCLLTQLQRTYVVAMYGVKHIFSLQLCTLDGTIFLLSGCCYAVSYTHLDVYKRQLWQWL